MEKTRVKIEHKHYRRRDDDYSETPKPSSTSAPDVLDDIDKIIEESKEAQYEHETIIWDLGKFVVSERERLSA